MKTNGIHRMSIAESAPCPENNFRLKQAAMILKSHRHWLHRPLLDPALPAKEQARQLYHAPFIVLAHTGDSEPVFCYGNIRALDLFELTWPELIDRPSRLSAGDEQQPNRQLFLETVAKQGYADDYQGIRVTKSGRLFRFQNATLWNLIDNNQQYCGQAAMFNNWAYVDNLE